jgi:hypothetical protein
VKAWFLPSREVLRRLRAVGSMVGVGRVVVLYRCQHGCCGVTEWVIDVFSAGVAIAMSPQFACFIAKGANRGSFLAIFAECNGEGASTETCMEITCGESGGA